MNSLRVGVASNALWVHYVSSFFMRISIYLSWRNTFLLGFSELFFIGELLVSFLIKSEISVFYLHVSLYPTFLSYINLLLGNIFAFFEFLFHFCLNNQEYLSEITSQKTEMTIYWSILQTPFFPLHWWIFSSLFFQKLKSKTN